MAQCANRLSGRSILMASQDIDYFALRYASLGARFEHAIDLGPECCQPSNFVVDGEQMRLGYGIHRGAGLLGSAGKIQKAANVVNLEP